MPCYQETPPQSKGGDKKRSKTRAGDKKSVPTGLFAAVVPTHVSGQRGRNPVALFGHSLVFCPQKLRSHPHLLPPLRKNTLWTPPWIFWPKTHQPKKKQGGDASFEEREKLKNRGRYEECTQGAFRPHLYPHVSGQRGREQVALFGQTFFFISPITFTPHPHLLFSPPEEINGFLAHDPPATSTGVRRPPPEPLLRCEKEPHEHTAGAKECTRGAFHSHICPRVLPHVVFGQSEPKLVSLFAKLFVSCPQKMGPPPSPLVCPASCNPH